MGAEKEEESNIEREKPRVLGASKWEADPTEEDGRLALDGTVNGHWWLLRKAGAVGAEAKITRAYGGGGEDIGLQE